MTGGLFDEWGKTVSITIKTSGGSLAGHLHFPSVRIFQVHAIFPSVLMISCTHDTTRPQHKSQRLEASQFPEVTCIQASSSTTAPPVRPSRAEHSADIPR